MSDIEQFADQVVANVFESFPDEIKHELLQIRELIFKIASQDEKIGKIQETLKWGQPAYLTPETKSGSTIRLGLPKQGGFAIFTHCQTTIMSEFQTLFPNEFVYDGNRAIHFQAAQPLPIKALEILIHRALTYHLKR